MTGGEISRGRDIKNANEAGARFSGGGGGGNDDDGATPAASEPVPKAVAL